MIYYAGEDIVERYRLMGVEKVHTPELFGIYRLYKAMHMLHKLPGFINSMIQKIFEGTFEGTDTDATRFLNSACNEYLNACETE